MFVCDTEIVWRLIRHKSIEVVEEEEREEGGGKRGSTLSEHFVEWIMARQLVRYD
jgi:hypothetical protein